MAENKGFGVVLPLFVLVIVGLALVQILANSVADTDTIRVGVNNSVTFRNGGAEVGNANLRSLGNIQPTTVRINNVTNNTMGSPASSGANFQAFSNGSIVLFTGTDLTQGATLCRTGTCTVNATYTYFSETYIQDSTSKTLLNLIPFFIILALVLFGYNKGWFEDMTG